MKLGRKALFLSALLTGLPGVSSALDVDTSKYFAYLTVPRPSTRHAQEYVFLSKDRCPSKNAPKDTKAALYYALQAQPGCWAERNGVVITCRANADGIGTDCYNNPKENFLDTSTLPKSARF